MAPPNATTAPEKDYADIEVEMVEDTKGGLTPVAHLVVSVRVPRVADGRTKM